MAENRSITEIDCAGFGLADIILPENIELETTFVVAPERELAANTVGRLEIRARAISKTISRHPTQGKSERIGCPRIP
mgnify:CR=1 FL=1